MTIKIVDGFSGAGGMHLGTASVGEVVLAIEKDKNAQATYRANFPTTPLEGDICEVGSLPEHDLFCAGFPCQPFSLMANGSGGRQGLLDPRGTLFYEIVRLLQVSKPKAFLLENVPALRSVDNGRAFAMIMSELREAGYTVEPRSVNAHSWVPQSRSRLFIMGIRTEGEDLGTLFRLKTLKIERPDPPHPVLSSILHEFVDPENAPGPMSQEMVDKIAQRDRDNKERGRGFQSTIVGSNGVARTLTARYASANRCNEILISLGGGAVRRITPREAARLMGFPDYFLLPEKAGHAYAQMGNAVVPQVVQAIVDAMMPLILR